MIPVFTANRLISVASSCAPATSLQVRRRLSSQPLHRHRKPATESTNPYGRLCVAPRPLSARFEPVPRLRSFITGFSRIPSDLARRTRPVWQCQTVPALSALLAVLPGVPRIRLRSAPAKLLRQLNEKALHLLRFSAPHGAPPPRGAAREFPHSSNVRCGPVVPARPGPAGRSDIAVVPPRPTIMPYGHGPAMPQVTAVDDQFGTHRLPRPVVYSPRVAWLPRCAASARRRGSDDAVAYRAPIALPQSERISVELPGSQPTRHLPVHRETITRRCSGPPHSS